jgi:hypothetical protein
VSALSSNSGEWMTPPWLVEKCRAALGGYISLDAATSDANNVGADSYLTAEDGKTNGALEFNWAQWFHDHGPPQKAPTLFLNPPGEKTGKLIRRFWRLWHTA